MITPILIYFLKVNLALAFLYICYRLLFRDDTFFRPVSYTHLTLPTKLEV